LLKRRGWYFRCPTGPAQKRRATTYAGGVGRKRKTNFTKGKGRKTARIAPSEK